MSITKNNRKSSTSSSYPGVSFHVGTNKWISRYYKNGKQVWIGSFGSEIEAAQAYARSTGRKLSVPNRVKDIYTETVAPKKAEAALVQSNPKPPAVEVNDFEINLQDIDLDGLIDKIQTAMSKYFGDEEVQGGSEEPIDLRSTPIPEPTTEEIEQRAYQLYLEGSNDPDWNWHEANRQLMEKYHQACNPASTGEQTF